jgi:hypothetical protein
VEGMQRVRLNQFVNDAPFFQAFGSTIPEEEGSEEELEALKNKYLKTTSHYQILLMV